jgi:hypothetical protein
MHLVIDSFVTTQTLILDLQPDFLQKPDAISKFWEFAEINDFALTHSVAVCTMRGNRFLSSTVFPLWGRSESVPWRGVVARRRRGS